MPFDEAALDRSIEAMLAMSPFDIMRIRAQLRGISGAEADALCDAASLGLGMLHSVQDSGQLNDWLAVFKEAKRQAWNRDQES